MTFGEIAHLVLAEALAAADGDPIQLTVRGRRIDVVVRDHHVVVQSSGGVLRVVCVVPPSGGSRATRDERVPLDDADARVGAMVRKAIEAGLTPF